MVARNEPAAGGRQRSSVPSDDRATEAPVDLPIRPPRLVGRGPQMAVLDDQVARVGAGEFRVVAVSGPAGSGKTRLAEEITRRHADRAVTLSARSYRWGGAHSFGLWIEALDRHLRAKPAGEIRRLCGGSADDLAAVLASVASVTPAAERQPQRARLLEGLVEVFDQLSRERPVLLAFDDVHLADSSSWEALRYLARRLTSAPIGIIATARGAELSDHAIATEVLTGLADDGLLVRLGLHALDTQSVAELARDVLRAEGVEPWAIPDSLVRWLVERSLGQPLFVVGLLRALVDEGADLARPRLDRIPETLRERINLDLGALDDAERELLEVLAVVDRRIDPSDLGRVTRRPMHQLGETLERLCRTRLVAEHGSGPALLYEIAHPIIQDAIYEAIGGTRRRLLHRAAGRALLASGDLGAAAVHFARSAEWGDDEVVAALCRALRQAEERGLYQEALTILEGLLDVLPEGDRRWVQVHDAMAWQSEWVLSHLAEQDAAIGVAAVRRMRAPVEESGDRAASAAVNFHLAAFLSFGLGRLDEAFEACRRAVEQFEAAGEPERALLARNELAWIEGCAGRLDRHAELAREVVTSALEDGYPRATVQAAGTAGYAFGLLGRFEEAERLFATGIELALEQGNSYRAAWTHAQLGVIVSLSGELDRARDVLERALEIDSAAADALTLENLAQCDWLAGRLEAGTARVDQSAVRRPIRGSRRRAWALALAARMQAEQGDRKRARTNLEAARTTFGDREIMAWSCWCPWAEGILAWMDGDPATGLDALDRAADRTRAIGAVPLESLILADRIVVEADADLADRAERSAERASEVAASCEGSLVPALADLTSAWADLVTGRCIDAVESGRRAERALAPAGYRLHAASAAEVVGRALRSGERDPAVETLQEAARAFDACGAAWRRDRVLDLLATLGSRGRRSIAAVRGPESLTTREHEVARLAARGHTAREIGERLFIGTRTVESHLQNVYGKLGVTSKRELVKRADELGLSGPTP